MSDALISVIVPIYKVEKYLDRCVSSIVNQTYNDLEIILVDDGSPDSCPQMCEAWAKRDGRIKVVHKENGGLSDARNAGLKVATGEYISFVDSDDWISEEFYSVLFDTIVKTGAELAECGFVKTSGEEPADRGNGKITVCGCEEAMEKHVRVEMFKQVVWNKLYRKSVVTANFEKGKCHEDEFWTYKIIANCKTLAHIDRDMYFYFQRDDSIMGIGYSVKRLDVLEAKLLRNEFIKKEFPSLSYLSDVDVRFTLMYHGQLALKRTGKSDTKEIFERIKGMYPFNLPYDKSGLKISHKFWLELAKLNLQLCCRLRNTLGIGL